MDTWTDPVFKGTTNTNTVNLGLTSLCTMACPNCHTSVPKYKAEGVARHAPVEWIRRDAVLMQGLRRVHVTGGEPSMHPHFAYIVENLFSWFKPEYLTIETNGTYYRKYRDLFLNFDKVFITHYVVDKIYPGNFDNTEVIAEAEKDLRGRLVREEPVLHDRANRQESSGSDEPCQKWYDPGLPCAWFDGLLYACCTTFGIDRSLGIPVTPDWREQIVRRPMGCDRCVFQGT